MTFVEEIRALQVPDNHVALSWIGQAGFLLKTASGKIVLIDPCLTDFVYETSHDIAVWRLAPALFQPAELEIDLLLSSHEHEDHLEVPSAPDYLSGPNAEIWCNEPSVELLKASGCDLSRVRMLNVGDVIQTDDFTLYVTDCDHGDETAYALGFVLDFGFTKIYYSGDTALTVDRLQQPLAMQPEIALLPINGEFGNLGSVEAAQYAAMLGSKVCVPHHIFTFAVHGGDPRIAMTAFPEYAPECELKFMTPGEIWMVGE